VLLPLRWLRRPQVLRGAFTPPLTTLAYVMSGITMPAVAGERPQNVDIIDNVDSFDYLA